MPGLAVHGLIVSLGKITDSAQDFEVRSNFMHSQALCYEPLGPSNQKNYPLVSFCLSIIWSPTDGSIGALV